ncbi:hypothetical protein PpBr36_03506 [Pyricularia pennisetigena]|uniref:hypothetical protein n=1 Tax=Pyricularia pennisetigena TaxID=1578925 RepID=UPI001154747B|nr:hypothetical protein PpBr36_03506 [Pyricularia pennisetigena]TLS30641.1 hypothetical protein PpBr36_03506 [Pyricularia pennisetigena]
MPSTSNPQLGRQLWAAIRDSVDISSLWVRFPGRTQAARCRIHPRPEEALRSLQQSPFPSAKRSFHTSNTARQRTTSTIYTKHSQAHIKRNCTSGSLLLLGLETPTNPSTQTTVATCAGAAADSVLLVSDGSSKVSISALARHAWRRSIHTGRGGQPTPRRDQPKTGNDEVKSSTGKDGVSATSSEDSPSSVKSSDQANPRPDLKSEVNPTPHEETLTESVSKYLHMPKMPHRPTKEELLAAANGFFQRLKVRFKWLSIRSMRPYNADEWGAFVSWFMLGHLVWILVGTTTFFSLIILFVNTVFAQETLAKWIGDYLTQSAGVTVVFESAIVPKWKDGVITFRNVFVSRRPGQSKSSVKKGSSTSAAAVAAARQTQPSEEDDGNYTQFDVTINTVNVTLSFYKWWNGTGLLKDVEVKGVRGVMDRTSVRWSDGPHDPFSYRHVHQPGDFEIEHFKLEDLLLTVHQPGGFRPFPVSIYSCELPQLRKQWLFYDFLNANHCSGSFDGSLFTIHPRQIHGVPAGEVGASADHLGEAGAWKKFSRIRIDGLKIDHLNRGVEGPFGWIYEGNVDMVADLMFPADEDDSLGKVMSDFYDKMEDAVTKNRYLRILDKNHRGELGERLSERFSRPATVPTPITEESRGHVSDYTTADADFGPSSPSSRTDEPPTPEVAEEEEPPRYLVMDLRIHLNDVRAAVPLFTHDISYISQPLVRPIVAYINAKRTYIPVTCRIVKRTSDFNGSWTIYDSGLMDDMSAEVYDAFARNVEDQHSRVRRLKKVGFWTLSMVVHALLAGVAGDLI